MIISKRSTVSLEGDLIFLQDPPGFFEDPPKARFKQRQVLQDSPENVIGSLEMLWTAKCKSKIPESLGDDLQD